MSKSERTRPAWVSGNLRLSGIDDRMIALLKNISRLGSITQAAKQSGLSYKGAWQIIERANNSSPKILLSTAIGGSKGGGTCLTEAGHLLLEIYSNLERQHDQFIEELNRQLAQDIDASLLLRRLSVKTSLRNQLFGRIVDIVTGAVIVQVTVELAGGDRLVVAPSLETVKTLNLVPGVDAVLLINSTDIALAAVGEAARFSASNCLPSTIIRIQQDAVNSEVSLLMPGGEVLTSVITTQSLEKMKLKAGLPVLAIFKANAPLLGVVDP